MAFGTVEITETDQFATVAVERTRSRQRFSLGTPRLQPFNSQPAGLYVLADRTGVRLAQRLLDLS